MSEKTKAIISTVFGVCCGILAALTVFGTLENVVLDLIITLLNYAMVSLCSAVGHYEVVFNE